MHTHTHTHTHTNTHTQTHTQRERETEDWNLTSTVALGEELNFQSVFKRRESVTVSDVMRQVIPGVGAIVGETAETMLLSFVAVYGEKLCIR